MLPLGLIRPNHGSEHSMLASQTNRMIWLHAALTALAVAAGTASAFAQQPPLDVGRAGALSGPSSGCEPGVAAGSLYTPSGQATGPSTSNANSAGSSAGTPTDFNVPLYTNPIAGVNTPLYSNPLEGDNVPLYGTPMAGQNAPLFTTPTLLSPYGGSQIAIHVDSEHTARGLPQRHSGRIMARVSVAACVHHLFGQLISCTNWPYQWVGHR